METRQVESFNRFASFVIHDLKNAVGMLSLTAENADDNIGNIEFQKDAIETIRKSVDKMKGLIDSLSAFKEPISIRNVGSVAYQARPGSGWFGQRDLDARSQE